VNDYQRMDGLRLLTAGGNRVRRSVPTLTGAYLQPHADRVDPLAGVAKPTATRPLPLPAIVLARAVQAAAGVHGPAPRGRFDCGCSERCYERRQRSVCEGARGVGFINTIWARPWKKQTGPACSSIACMGWSAREWRSAISPEPDSSAPKRDGLAHVDEIIARHARRPGAGWARGDQRCQLSQRCISSTTSAISNWRAIRLVSHSSLRRRCE
jgi:hypothetical protein